MEFFVELEISTKVCNPKIQSNSNGAQDDNEPRSRIKRDEQSGEIVEYRHENGESYKEQEIIIKSVIPITVHHFRF